MRRRRAAPWLISLALLVPWAAGPEAWAANARITDIIVTQGSDDLLVFATLEHAFTKEIEESIVNGVPTTFTYYLRLMQRRSLFPDSEVASLTVGQGVSYDLLKDEFTFVRDQGKGRLTRITKSYPQVKRWMGELDGVRLGSLRRLKRGEVYYISVKAEIRSIKLIFPLNYLFFFLSFFNFDTPWERSAYFQVSR